MADIFIGYMIGWVRFTAPCSLSPQRCTANFTYYLQKYLVFNNKQNQILSATTEKKSNFYFPRKQSMVPLYK